MIQALIHVNAISFLNATPRNMSKRCSGHDESTTYLLKVVAHYLGCHQHQHDRQAVRHVACGFNHDDRQTQRHSHNAPYGFGGQGYLQI